MPTEPQVTAMALTLMRDKRTDQARDAQRARARRRPRALRAYQNNAYMQLLAGARAKGKRTFEYVGRTYERDARKPWIYRRRDD